MTTTVEKVNVGPWFFEYDEENRQLLIGQGEEVGGMMESAQPEDWMEFVQRVQSGDVEIETT